MFCLLLAVAPAFLAFGIVRGDGTALIGGGGMTILMATSLRTHIRRRP